MTTALLMFLIFIVITLGITYWAARRSSGVRLRALWPTEVSSRASAT